VFACPLDDLLGALAIPTIHWACEMAVGRINRKAAAGAAKQEPIFNTGFDQFVVWVSLCGLARFRFVIAGLRLLDNWWLRLDFGRVCGWRAMHAVSLGHWRASLWLGLEPGRKLQLPLGLPFC
jgi:hypothetical protein